VKVFFGDLPADAQAMLTRHLRIDFSPCDFKAPRWFSAWARNDNGHVVGIFAVEFPFWFEGKVTVLVLDPRCLSRRVLRAVFTALFSQAKRLTAEVEPGNLRALRQVQRLGFHFEGHHPLGLEGCRDTIIFGMLKEECPWLPSYVPPALSPLDVAHRHLSDVIVRSDGSLWTKVRSDRKHLNLGELGIGSVLPSPGSPFDQIGAAGPPADMAAVDAVPHAAGMRGIHWPRGVSVRSDADDAVNFPAGAAVSHLCVAPVVNGKRPKQAFVSNVSGRVSEKTFRGQHLEPHVLKG
jgi:hypothetical protein